MQKTKFTETQIVASIKKQESGIPVTEICRELGIHKATFYNWKAKYGGSCTILHALLVLHCWSFINSSTASLLSEGSATFFQVLI